MTIRYYPAAIERGENGKFIFQAIDIPGALSQGDTPEAALANGVEALQIAVDTWDDKADGPLPEPTPWTDVTAKLDDEARAALFAIQLAPVVLPERAVKVTITLPGDLLKRIDMAAGNYGRSGWLADAARERLAARTDILPDPNSIEVRVLRDFIKQKNVEEMWAQFIATRQPVYDLNDQKLTPRGGAELTWRPETARGQLLNEGYLKDFLRAAARHGFDSHIEPRVEVVSGSAVKRDSMLRTGIYSGRQQGKTVIERNASTGEVAGGGRARRKIRRVPGLEKSK
jgi:predicted RNase H-like HicB family nuclease